MKFSKVKEEKIKTKLIQGGRMDQELFKTFKTSLAIHGITTKKTGDFGYRQSVSEELFQNLRLVQTFEKTSFIKVKPEHRDKVKELTNGIHSGYYKCDSLIWQKSNNSQGDPVLMSTTADCPTVTMAGENILAIVHSGRASSALKIIPKTLAILKTKFSANLNSLEVCFWPGICQNCYEISPKLAEKFPKDFIKQGPKTKLDLRGFILYQLCVSGINPENINIFEYCSAHSTDNGDFLFNSHRRDGNGVRNLVFLFSKPIDQELNLE